MNTTNRILSSIHHLSLTNLTSIPCRSYAFKSDLKIKWVRPEKIPCIKPEKSGDIEGMMKIDLTQPQLLFRQSKELETANDTVKKLFSLEYAPRKRMTQVYNNELKEMVRRHQFDNGSIEVKLARWTGIIRAYQELMERFPRNKKMKVVLKELIDRRKKHLKYLRRWDYKKFEWILEVLKIVYKPPPNHFHWITRKESLRKLTNNYCEELKEERLKTYREMLQAEQPAFLQEKIRALEFIRNEEKECGAEVTVTEEEIEEARNQLKKLEEQRKNNTEES